MATENQLKIANLANCLYSFKLTDSGITKLDFGAARLLDECRVAASIIDRPNNTDPFSDHGFTEEQASIVLIRSIANTVLEVADEVSSFISRAASAGFVPPSNPFLEITSFNSRRSTSKSSFGGNTIKPLILDDRTSGDILFNITVFLNLIEKEKTGEIDFTLRRSKDSAQVSSYDMSFDGFDILTTGDGSDLLSFLPDADMIKRRRIRKALSALSFDNREPQVLFTSNYDPDGISKGCIIGWIKNLDASGYILKRYNIIDDVTDEWTLSNEVVQSHYRSIEEYVEEWALTFYEIDKDRIYAFLDDSIEKDIVYDYKIQAYQNVRTDKNFVFESKVSQFILSQLQIKDITLEMQSHVDNTLGKTFPNATVDDISPYPFLSKKFYGHDKFDWILAATNVKAAIDRGDNRTEVRKFSYLGSSMTHIESQILQNKFYRPIDPNMVVRNIKESIGTFGLSQTLIEIIETTGLNMFFGSKESPQEDTFKRASDVLDETELDEIESILSSIDPETATVDVSVLTHNMIGILQGKNDNTVPDETSVPTQISIPDEQDETADNQLQFIGNFDPNEEILDLATFEGISDFVRMIRMFFDMSPNRNTFESTVVSDRKISRPQEQTQSVDIKTSSSDVGTDPRSQ